MNGDIKTMISTQEHTPYIVLDPESLSLREVEREIVWKWTVYIRKQETQGALSRSPEKHVWNCKKLYKLYGYL